MTLIEVLLLRGTIQNKWTPDYLSNECFTAEDNFNVMKFLQKWTNKPFWHLWSWNIKDDAIRTSMQEENP